MTGDTRSLRPLGQILLENQVITEEQLDTALRNRVEGLRTGGSMLMQGLISAEQLAQALAEQNGVAWSRSTPGRSFITDCRNAGLRGAALCSAAAASGK